MCPSIAILCVFLCCLSAQCDWAAECGAVRAEQPLEFMPEGVDFLAARAKMAVVAPLILAGVAPARVLRGGAPAERTVQVPVIERYRDHERVEHNCLAIYVCLQTLRVAYISLCFVSLCFSRMARTRCPCRPF